MLSQAGAPQDHPAHPRSTPGQAAEVQAFISQPCGAGSRERQAAGTHAPGREFGTVLPDWLRPAAKSCSLCPPHCGRNAPPVKAGEQQAGLRGEPPRTAGTGSPAPRWGDATDSNSWYLSPTALRLRFHNVSSDLSTSCHQTSHPVPTRSISPQRDRVSPERYRHSRFQRVCWPRLVAPWSTQEEPTLQPGKRSLLPCLQPPPGRELCSPPQGAELPGAVQPLCKP